MQSRLKNRVLSTVAGAGLAAMSLLAVGCGDDDGVAGTGAMDAGGTGGDSGTGGAGMGGSGGDGGTGDTDGGAGTGGVGGTGGTGGGEPCNPTTETTNVTANITADTHWTCGTYLLQDIIYVTGDSTLTIDPGVVVQGDASLVGQVTALIVTRGSTLEAVGTEDEPIVFTSSKNPGFPADWGGVALLGQATLNSGNCVGGTGDSCAGGHFENVIEGLDPDADTSKYGGSDDASSCGTLKYARIEYAGYQLAPNKELNGLSVGACGSGTELSYIQVHRGSDDGIEMFGGTAGFDHVVISFSADDGLDWDLGWRGRAQFLVVHQEPGCTTAAATCDQGFESDNNGDNEIAAPVSKPTIFNATLIGSEFQRGMLLREGTQGVLRNMLVTGFSTAVDIRDLTAPIATFWPSDLSIESSCFFDNATIGDADGDMDDDQGFNENDAINASARNNVFNVDPMFASVAVAGPDYRPASTMLGGKATPPAGFDTSATYCGAFEQGGDDWTANWTAFPVPRDVQ